MTNAEMNRRLATLAPNDIERVEGLIGEGWGAQSIKIETGATLKQVNAVFQKKQGKP